jgi:uncharacterized membrane protein YsdA (DUF1294 family)
MNNPTLRYGILTFGIAIILTLLLWGSLKTDIVLTWLIAITLVTFFAYGYDKAIAGSKITRVPESVLLALTLLGGTLGAILGMQVFHHKTSKESFRAKFWIVLLIQVALVILYFYLKFRQPA